MHRSYAMRRTLLVALGLGTAACRPRLPGPALAPSGGENLVDVTSPPPAAHVEFVPPRPREDAVWVDGQWTWDTKWRWAPGGWVAPPPGARFAPWRIFRREDGSLVLAPPAWRDARGAIIPEPPVLAKATPAHAAPEPETEPEEERRPVPQEQLHPQAPSREEEKPSPEEQREEEREGR